MAKSTPRPVCCTHCSAEFITCWPKQIFCSKICKISWHNAKIGATKVGRLPRLCDVCGATYTPIRRDSRTCSQPCRTLLNVRRRAGHDVRTRSPECQWCSQPFIPTRSDQNYCSPPCWARHRHRLRMAARDPRMCVDCGADISERKPDTLYCSDCKLARMHVWRVARRAQLQSIPEPFTLEQIAERDKWTCQLCTKRVNRKLKWPHRLSPSIDHVIPLSLGGEHSKANVQLAHLVCNCVKGNRMTEPVQLSLVG